MKIAVTGCSGAIGRCLVRSCEGQALRLLGRSADKLRKTFGVRSGFSFYETAYDIASLERALDGVAAVVHLAAIRPDARYDRFADYYENVRISENLFSACRRTGVTNVVYASSTSIYNSHVNGSPFFEDEPVRPTNFYGASKLLVEQIGEIYDLNIKSLRIAAVVGPDVPEKYMRMAFIQQALRGRPLVVFGSGRESREYVYEKDVVRAIGAALRLPERCGVFNIGMGTAVSNLQYAHAVKKIIAGGNLEIIIDETKFDRGGCHLMSNKKAKKILGFVPRYDLNAALLEIRAALAGTAAKTGNIS